MTTDEALKLAKTLGFSHAGDLNMGALHFLPEVREMCASGKCSCYGTRWTCPPHCGTLEESAARAAKYSRGILVQTTGVLEDSFDFENMMKAEKRHKACFFALVEGVRGSGADCLPMSAGACTVCRKCTCPDAPCRFPEKSIPSMEAFGLLVSDVCRDSGLGYYYGPNTVTYTSCILLG